MSVTGYLQAVYENQTDTNDDGAVPPDSFSLKRIRVRLKSDINAWLGFTIMFEVAGAQSPLRDGFLSFKLPHHELKVGQQKTQFGYENPLSSTKLFTVNRALVSDTLGRGSDLRDIGLGVFGTWKLPPDFEAGYAVTFVNGAGANRKEDTELKNVWGRAGVTYAPHDLGITSALGVSFARGDQLDPGSLPMDPADDFDARFHRLGVDMELEAKWVFAAFEYIRGTTDTGGGAEADSQGWYVLAAGKTPWHVGPVLKIDQLDPNMDAADDSRLRYTFGAYADIGKAFRVLGNYELDRSDKRKDDTMLLFVQLVY